MYLYSLYDTILNWSIFYKIFQLFNVYLLFVPN